MPDIVVHNAMGDRVLQKLPDEISGIIDYDIFRFAVMGPDPYIFYRFFAPKHKHKIDKRSKRMHKTSTGAFLMELAQNCNDDRCFSFLAGFSCHYALDSTAHPYINSIAKGVPGMHGSIEHKLDVIELKRQSKGLGHIMKLFTDYPDIPEVKNAMEKIYGWDDKYFRISYRHMKLFHWLAIDHFGLVNLLLRNAKGRKSTMSYKNRKSDHLDLSGFDELEKESEQLAVSLIKAVYQYRNKEISENELRSIIGNRSYSGGEAR